jgi:hypothetical protein
MDTWKRGVSRVESKINPKALRCEPLLDIGEREKGRSQVRQTTQLP